MALSRLHDAVTMLVLKHLKDEDELHPQQRSSGMVKHHSYSRWRKARKVIMENGILSLFTDDGEVGDRTFNLVNRCKMADISFDQYHQLNEFELSNDEVKYLVKSLKTFLVDDDVAIDDPASIVLLKQSPVLLSTAANLYLPLQDHCIAAARSYMKAFIDTLGEQYLKPLLIARGIEKGHAAKIVSGMSFVSTLQLNDILTRTVLSSVMKSFLEDMLQTVGVAADMIEEICSKISMVAAAANSPFDLIELNISGGAAEAGQFAAYHLVYQLPKIQEAAQETATEAEEFEWDFPVGVDLSFAH